MQLSQLFHETSQLSLMSAKGSDSFKLHNLVIVSVFFVIVSRTDQNVYIFFIMVVNHGNVSSVQISLLFDFFVNTGCILYFLCFMICSLGFLVHYCHLTGNYQFSRHHKHSQCHRYLWNIHACMYSCMYILIIERIILHVMAQMMKECLKVMTIVV